MLALTGQAGIDLMTVLKLHKHVLEKCPNHGKGGALHEPKNVPKHVQNAQSRASYTRFLCCASRDDMVVFQNDLFLD